MIRQPAFADDGLSFLKGGLHCHTVRSDGKLTPQEVLAYAAGKAYDFLALTDHQIYNYTNYLPESRVLVIPGTEFANNFENGNGYRCFHTVFLGHEKADGNGFEQDQVFPYINAGNSEEYQPMLDLAHQNRNLTILCHPQWSCTSAKHFQTQKGNFAMEIYNSGAALNNDCDTDAAYWDEILGQGLRWYGVAADDAHRIEELCKGWVMVKAEKTVAGILDALQNGAFYSSCGPVIRDFYIDNGQAVIDCSPVSCIRLHSDRHPTRVIRDATNQLTHAVFDLVNCWEGAYQNYVRISVIDPEGKKAWTNPIFF